MPSFATISAVSLSFVAAVSATIAPASPIASTTCTGGKACKISWIEDNTQPLASAFGPTTVGLYVGNKLQQTLLQNFGTVQDPSKTLTLSAKIDPTSGPDGSDYFIRFQSVSAKDSTNNPLESFSAKFQLTGMTGNFSQAIENQINGVASGVTAEQVITATGGQAATVSNLAATAAPAATGSSSQGSGAMRTGVTAATSLVVVGGTLALLL